MRQLRLWSLLFAVVGTMALFHDADARQGGAKDKPKTKSDKKKSDKEGKEKTAFADLGDIHSEVTVLQVLHALQPTRAQLELMAKLAPKTMNKPPVRKLVKVTDKYKKALVALRDALISGNDDKIDDATADFDDIRENEDPDYEDVDITDEARKAARTVLRAFSARQVAVYIGGLDDFPDPAEQLRDAIAESRKRTGKEWMAYRDDLAYQVGWLVAGLNSTKEEKTSKAVTSLLNKAASMSEKTFKQKRDELESEAREILGTLGPTDIIRNFMERLLAETLSNYRLAKAIEALTAASGAKD